MLTGLSRLAAIVIFTTFTVPGWAHTGTDYSHLYQSCGELVSATMGGLTAASIRRGERASSIVPPPSFDYIERNQREQVGDDSVPLSFQQSLGLGIKFIANHAPGTPHAMTVRPTTEKRSFPMLVTTEFAGSKRATAAYVTLPNSPGKESYLIGSEYEVANVQLHGWGTPSATAANGMEQGEFLAEDNIPSIAFDQPGHGMATRNPEGLLDIKGQVLLLLDQIDATIAPNVKVNISGHSGGGIMALAMHIMSRDPEYAARFKRIKRFFSMSPMIDASMRGDASFNHFFQKSLEKQLDELRPRMANSDFQFVKNMLRNGKDSDVGGIFATLGMFNFVTAPYTEDQKRDLKPFTMIMGEKDALVYVGFEEIFTKIFGKARPPEAFDPDASFQWILLGAGKTWKTEKLGDDVVVDTGHQLADRLFETGPYKGRRQLYTWLSQWLISMNGGKKPTLAPEDDATKKFGDTFRAYATFFGHRELLASDVQYVSTSSPDMQQFSNRLRALGDYVNAANKATGTAEKELPKRQEAARDELRRELGIEDKIDKKGAVAELEATKVELPAERRAQLEAYVQNLVAIDDKLRAGYKDPVAEKEYADLWASYADVLNQIEHREGEGHYEAYNRVFKEMTVQKDQKKKDANLDEEKKKTAAALYSRLSSLHQAVRKVDVSREKRYGTERDNLISAVPRPDGIADGRTASRELRLDRSPARREKLTQYLARLDAVEQAAAAILNQETNAAVASIQRPDGVSDPVEARLAREKHGKMMSMAWAPAGSPAAAFVAKYDEAHAGAEQLRAGMRDKNVVITPGVEAIAKQVADLRNQRAALTKRWEELTGIREHQKSESEYEEFRPFTSDTLQLYYDHEEAAYDAYNQAHKAYAKEQFLTSKHVSGELTAQDVLQLTPELHALREKFYGARANFVEAVEETKKMEWVEAIGGRLRLSAKSIELGVDPKGINEARTIARTLYGSEYAEKPRPNETCLISQLAAEEAMLEKTRVAIWLLERQRDEARLGYAQAMNATGEKTPYIITKVPIFPFFNQDRTTVLDQLRTDPVKANAVERLRLRWEPIVSELKASIQTKGDNAAY